MINKYYSDNCRYYGYNIGLWNFRDRYNSTILNEEEESKLIKLKQIWLTGENDAKIYNGLQNAGVEYWHIEQIINEESEALIRRLRHLFCYYRFFGLSIKQISKIFIDKSNLRVLNKEIALKYKRIIIDDCFVSWPSKSEHVDPDGFDYYFQYEMIKSLHESIRDEEIEKYHDAQYLVEYITRIPADKFLKSEIFLERKKDLPSKEEIKDWILKDHEGWVNRTSLGCFIATLVYRNPDHINIRYLWSFRDNYLKTNSFGQQLTKMYYYYSPGIVLKLNNRIIKWFIRIMLLNPLVFLITNSQSKYKYRDYQ